jgi:hypothetical protein
MGETIYEGTSVWPLHIFLCIIHAAVSFVSRSMARASSRCLGSAAFVFALTQGKELWNTCLSFCLLVCLGKLEMGISDEWVIWRERSYSLLLNRDMDI